MSLSTYLVQRGKRGTWQLRVPVPRALHAPGRPRERVRSMGTTDRRIASDRALRVLDEWKREWAVMRGEAAANIPARADPPSIALPDHELDEAAVVLGYELPLSAADAGRRTLAGKGGNMYRAHVNFVRAELEEQVRAAATGDDGLVRELAEEAMAALGVDLDRGGEAYRKLVDRLNASRLANLQAQHRRNVGELEAVGESPVIERVRQRERDKARPGETLLDLFDRYAEQRLAEEGKRGDTLAQDRKVVEQFAEFVGADRAVASIKPEHVRDYRDTMRQLPPKWRDRADMRGLTMREAAVKARSKDMPRVALTTINKHLSTISPLFAWLIEERWDLSNPCTGLFFKRVKGKNPRPPLGTERLNAVLASPLFTGFEADGKEHRPGEIRAKDWRYWIPMLCLFTGMRVGEAAQLRAEDVSRHESGVWIIDIQHAPEKGQTTKAGQSRASVAHAKLVELGFIAFVEERRAAGGDSRLFPELVANDRDQLGAEPSAFWRDYLTRIGVKAGADGLGAHSFRHELADRLRVEVGLVDDQIAVALGHDQKSTTAGYGAVRQGTVRFLAPVMEQVRFDGVQFGHLAPKASK
jgi:integrase